jgi:hypothetical protein
MRAAPRPIDIFCAAYETDAEGVVAKRKNGVYASGERWFKIKNPNYPQTEGRRELFDSFRPGPKRAKLPTASVEKTGA